MTIDPSSEELVSVPVPGGGLMYVQVRSLDGSVGDEEREIAAVRPTLDHVLETVTAFSSKLLDSLRKSQAPRVAVEFSVELAVETGQFVAILGKASSKSTLKVTLEWTQPST